MHPPMCKGTVWSGANAVGLYGARANSVDKPLLSFLCSPLKSGALDEGGITNPSSAVCI